MAYTTAQQQFLRDHPNFREVVQSGNNDAIRDFLQRHPNLANNWAAVTNPAPKAAPTAAAPAPAAAPAAAAPVAGGTEGASAKAALTGALAQFGLEGLGEWAWGQYLAGTPSEQIMLDLRSRPEYQARFPAMAALSKAGKAISEAEYIAAERSYQSQMRAYGLPEGFYDDPSDFSKLIAGNVSAQEFGERLQIAQQTALQSPQGQVLRDELSRLYGVTGSVGAITAYWIDPDKSATLLKQQFAASQIAAESATTGFGSLTRQQAELVGGTGVSADQARSTFQSLAQMDELKAALPGDTGDQAVTDDDLLGAAFTGDAKAKTKVEKAARRRVAEFDGGGGYAASGKGVSGLGSA